MTKLLHFSDLHLDTSFDQDNMSKEYGNWRRQHLRETLGKICTIARTKKVTAITIAGDLYDQQFALPETGQFLAQQFSQLNPIRVLIAPGEKDPNTNNSLYTIIHWPDNVHIFTDNRLRSIDLPGGLTVWGASCPVQRGSKLFENINLDPKNRHILLLHGSVKQFDEKMSRNIFELSIDEVRKVGFTSALLGSNHNGNNFIKVGDPIIVYPGSPEPISKIESDGLHQINMVDFSDDAVKVGKFNS